MMPESSFIGLLKLPFYALARMLWLQGDLPNHDLHHVGRGSWTEFPYVRTRLLLDCLPLRQTVSLRAMFSLPMRNRNVGSQRELPNRDHLLQM
jgi:hypothetical protein